MGRGHHPLVTNPMALRHHLRSFVTQDEGADGLPTAYSVAKKAGISTNTIYRLSGDEFASISPQVLNSLCSALDCQPGDLLTFEPDAEG